MNLSFHQTCLWAIISWRGRQMELNKEIAAISTIFSSSSSLYYKFLLILLFPLYKNPLKTIHQECHDPLPAELISIGKIRH
jgi:hypothetical protein